MTEFDPEAYLEQKLTGNGDEAAAGSIPPPPPLPANGAEAATAEDERPSRRERSRDGRSSRRSRSGDRDRGGDRKRDRSRSKERKERERDRPPPRREERRPRYDESYRLESSGRGDKDTKTAAQKAEEDYERDLRTVFIAQVARKADERDLFAFFCECGKVTDVRIIKDTQTRRSKGIAYVEFEKQENCLLAVAKSGQIICGFPVVIQPSQAEKNIAARQAALGAIEAERPSKVSVSNLHKDIGHDDLEALFSPFGQVLSAHIVREQAPTNTGTVTFKLLAEAQKAVVHLNNFDLAGSPLVVQLVQEAPRPMAMALQGAMGPAAEMLDDHETGGVQVTAQSRAALMAKLARGQEFSMSQGPMPYPPMGMQHQMPPIPQAPAPPPPMPSIAMANLPPAQSHPSEYVLLVNMFDPSKESEPDWHLDIQDDVQAECAKFGQVMRCVADRNSPQGLVYLKFDHMGSSAKACQALNGRFFAGKAIAALYLNSGIWEKFVPCVSIPLLIGFFSILLQVV